MTAATNYLENELLDHALGTGAFTAPTGHVVKLHIGDPGEAGTGNPAAETTTQSVSFGAASGGTATASATVSWTSVSNSETYSHISILDGSANVLFYGALTAPVAVTAGDDFDLTSLTVSLD